MRRAALRVIVRGLLISVFGAACDPGGTSTDATPAAWSPEFTPVQADILGEPGALTNAWADIDGDGDSDLFVGFNGSPNRLYRNDNGVLVDVASELGLAEERSTRTSAPSISFISVATSRANTGSQAFATA